MASGAADLLAHLREDWAVHQPRAWTRPGFHALAVYRLGAWLRDQRLPPLVGQPTRAVYRLLAFVTHSLYGIELQAGTRVGRRLYLPHHGGMVLGAAVIGDDCIVRQNVTIGTAVVGGERPRIGNGVDIGAGAVIVGDVTVGDGAKIGPNAVVTRSVPPGSLVVAPPARIVGGLRRDEVQA